MKKTREKTKKNALCKDVLNRLQFQIPGKFCF